MAVPESGSQYTQYVEPSNRTQTSQRIYDGTTSPNIRTGHRSFTHAEVLARIAEDSQFKTNFNLLPNIIPIIFADGDEPPWLLVGHTYLRDNRLERVWARVRRNDRQGILQATDLDFELDFCLTDATACPLESYHVIWVDGTFANLGSATRTQFKAVLLIYLVEKGHLQDVAFRPEFMRDLKEACAQIAKGCEETPGSATPSSVTARASEEESDADVTVFTQTPSEDNTYMQTSFDHSSCWSPGPAEDEPKTDPEISIAAEHPRPEKRQRVDEDFAEYQNLVQRIRKRARTNRDTLKDENERLKAHVRQLEADNDDMEQSMEEHNAENAQLSDDLLIAREEFEEETCAQVEKICKLEKELMNAKVFMEKIKAMF